MQNKINKAEMSETDIRETYEMLRAAHTLNRMAFGAVAMLGDFDEEKAKHVTESFDTIFKIISDVALGLYESLGTKPATSSDCS